MKVKLNSSKLDCRIVFSALDAAIAGEAEADLARRGYAVISKAKNHRFDENVPLLVPEINSGQVELIKAQNTLKRVLLQPTPTVRLRAWCSR